MHLHLQTLRERAQSAGFYQILPRTVLLNDDTHLFEDAQVPAMVFPRIMSRVLCTRHIRYTLCMYTDVSSWIVRGLR